VDPCGNVDKSVSNDVEVGVNYSTPQPQNSDIPSDGIDRYSNVLSVGIDLCRHLLGVAESGVGIAYTDRLVYSDQQSDALGAIYTDR